MWISDEKGILVYSLEFRNVNLLRSRRFRCARTVPESDVFMPLGLALSEKQIPQTTENTEKAK
jgi:hypothetical protein